MSDPNRYKLKSVKVSTTEKYDFRFSTTGYAIIFLDDVSGMVSMQTDWGNFDYRWSSIGTDTLKQFLVGCDIGYLMGKFCSRTYFDVDRTKKDMIKMVEDEILLPEDKKLCLQEIKDADWASTETVYHTLESQCPTLYKEVFKEDMYGVPTHMDYTPCERGFFEDVWPLIKAKFMEANGETQAAIVV